MDRLYDIAKILRSKNSGPFEITLDVLFDDRDTYERVKASGVFTKESIAKLYKIPEDRVMTLVFFDAALGIKVTFLRQISSGTICDRDVYGSQQHAPLMDIMIS